MSKSESGRVVIEIDPELKRYLYSALALDQQTLKEWFVNNAERYISSSHKRNLDNFTRKSD